MKPNIFVFETDSGSQYQLNIKEDFGDFYKVVLIQLKGGITVLRGVSGLPQEGRPFVMHYTTDEGTKSIRTNRVRKVEPPS
ncbi:hypothetical protein GTO10_02540 [Candidatus Saccharibacteria bacterium]|nr:hypothetical protein [Candidatus Saccharibacteria bacterium]